MPQKDLAPSSRSRLGTDIRISTPESTHIDPDNQWPPGSDGFPLPTSGDPRVEIVATRVYRFRTWTTGPLDFCPTGQRGWRERSTGGD